jgi:hypothetical protein
MEVTPTVLVYVMQTMLANKYGSTTKNYNNEFVFGKF